MFSSGWGVMSPREDLQGHKQDGEEPRERFLYAGAMVAPQTRSRAQCDPPRTGALICGVSTGTVILGPGKIHISAWTLLSVTPTFLSIWTSTQRTPERATWGQLETALANVTVLPGTGSLRCQPGRANIAR